MGFIVFIRDGCSFCHCLLKGLERLKLEYGEKIIYEVQLADDNEPAPYILRLDENQRVIGKLIGFHEKVNLLNFLEIPHEEQTKQKATRKIKSFR